MTMMFLDNGRGLHPKLRASSHRFWMFDDGTTTVAQETIASDNLAQLGSDPLPFRAPSFIGQGCLRITDGRALIGSSNASLSTMTGDWTATCWIRLRAIPITSYDVAWYFGGDNISELSADNHIAVCRIQTDGTVEVMWEHTAGVDVSYNFVHEPLTLNEWTMITLRKYDSPVTGKRVDLLINGFVVDTSGDLTNADGGTNAVWMMGGLEEDGGVTNGINTDIASLHVYSSVLTDDEVAEDYRRALGLTHPMAGFARVEIRNGTTLGYEDMQEVAGRDWLVGVDISEPGYGEPLRSGSINLYRDVGNLSLAPLRTDGPSLANVVGQNYPVKIYLGREPLCIAPEPQDLAPMLVGQVRGKIDWSKDVISIDVLDEGANLIDNGFIEEERPYGATGAGVAVETVMQSILDDNDDNGGTLDGAYPATTLNVPYAPGWQIRPYEQKREPVLTALRTLAMMIGYEVRYRWDPDPTSPGYKLTFFEPQREKDQPDLVFSLDDLYSMSTSSLDDTNVRTVARGVYPSRETVLPTKPSVAGTPFVYTTSPNDQGWVNVDGQGNNMPAFISIEHAAQRDALGRRFMEFQEDGASQIDEIGEMFSMLTAALYDLADPEYEVSFEVPMMYEATSQTLVLLLASFLAAANQTPACVDLSFSCGGSKPASTKITARGKPSLGPQRWLEIEARPGKALPPLVDPTKPLTSTVIGGLNPGLVALLTRSQLVQNQRFINIPNADFSTWSGGTENAPDNWKVINFGEAVTTDIPWGNKIVNAPGQVGGNAVKIERFTTWPTTNDLEVLLQKHPVPVAALDKQPFTVVFRWKRNTGSGTLVAPEILLFAVDETGFEVGSAQITIKVGSGGTTSTVYRVPSPGSEVDVWYESRIDGVMFDPDDVGDARFLQVGATALSGSPGDEIVLDSIAVYATSREMFAGCGNGIVGGVDTGGSWVVVNFETKYNATVIASGSEGGYGEPIERAYDYGDSWQYDDPDWMTSRRYPPQDGTPVSDAAWGTPGTYDVTITSAGSNLPVVPVGSRVRVLNHSNGNNNQQYMVTASTASSMSVIGCVNGPVSAAAEPVDFIDIGTVHEEMDIVDLASVSPSGARTTLNSSAGVLPRWKAGDIILIADHVTTGVNQEYRCLEDSDGTDCLVERTDGSTAVSGSADASVCRAFGPHYRVKASGRYRVRATVFGFENNSGQATILRLVKNAHYRDNTTTARTANHHVDGDVVALGQSTPHTTDGALGYSTAKTYAGVAVLDAVAENCVPGDRLSVEFYGSTTASGFHGMNSSGFTNGEHIVYLSIKHEPNE